MTPAVRLALEPGMDPGIGHAIDAAIPPHVAAILEQLHATGHAAYVVGGSIRDVLLGRVPADWDIATDARPERLATIFAGARSDNPFGTVFVPTGGGPVEITTFRTDRDYADFRRPTSVEFGDRIEDDLARRDFTVNAIAWGGAPGAAPALLDPYDGRGDIGLRRLRAVGAADLRFREDALRTLRAVRLAAVLGFAVEPATLAAMRDAAPLTAHLSGERVATEIERLLAAARPSIGLRLAFETGLLPFVAPLLAAERGVAQNKFPNEDLWDHTLRTVDAAATADRSPIVRLAALLHDVGKPATAADGHFHGHDVVGAEQAADLLRRWHRPRETVERIAHLIRHHMFAYETAWSDAAVRRFIGKVGRGELDDLFALRAADNVGSGRPAEADGLGELRQRVARELAADVALDRSGLAIDGADLVRELGLAPGPEIGRILDRLVARVIADPAVNDRDRLLGIARAVPRR
ncbi:MAG: HD domain-containing protein [Chloroflexi bacterium]|nr:HD domain-containing protein [Chloroflexota bacterium]